MNRNVKIVVTVPVTYADALRETIGRAGAGRIGNYAFCSFSIKGIGCFKPLEGAHPAIGEIGKMETVDEERIEVTCACELVDTVVSAIKSMHPYEEPVIDIYTLE